MTPLPKLLAGIVALGTIGFGGTMVADQSANPYTDKGSTLEIEATSTVAGAGANKVTVDKTQPKLTLSKFDGALNMGLTYQGFQASGSRKFLSDEVDWTGADQQMQVIPLAASSTFEDGGYEINVRLNSKPASNVFKFSVDNANQFDFFYQPPLDQAPMDPGITSCTEMQCFDKDGTLRNARPENVVGSYAVYYKAHANHIDGQTNYSTGKAFHIFRPKVTDAKQNSVWATLSYSDGVLSLAVPQDFLDNAVYPVLIDPTIGYTTAGATDNFFSPGNNAIASMFGTYAASSGDSITQFSIYTSNFGSDGPTKMVAYTVSGSNPSSRTGSVVSTTISGSTFQWYNISASISLTGGTTYCVAAGEWATGTFDIKSDAGSAGDENFNTSSSLTASWTSGSTAAKKFSMYATVTAGGGGGTATPDDGFMLFN